MEAPYVVDGVEYITVTATLRRFDTSRSTLVRRMNDGRVRVHPLPTGVRMPCLADVTREFKPRSAPAALTDATGS